MFRSLAPPVQDAAALRDAVSGFVGGGVFTGKTCSALTAGVMALGLLDSKPETSRLRVLRMIGRMAIGTDAFADDLNEYSRVMNRGRSLATWFEQAYGSTQCSALTQCDLSTAAGAQKYVESACVTGCRAITEGVAEQVRRMVRHGNTAQLTDTRADPRDVALRAAIAGDGSPSP